MRKALLFGLAGILLSVPGKAQQEPYGFKELLALFGQSKSKVIKQLGKPSRTEKGDENGKDLIYRGFTIQIHNNLFNELRFEKNQQEAGIAYRGDIFPGITFQGENETGKLTVDWLVRFLGQYESMEEEFETGYYKYYYWLNRALVVTVIDDEGINSLKIKSKHAAELFSNNQQYPITPANLACFLNKDEESLKLFPLLIGKPEKTIKNKETTYLMYPARGFGYSVFGTENNRTGLLLLANNDGAFPGSGKLPYGLTLNIKMPDAYKKFGDPDDASNDENYIYLTYYFKSGEIMGYETILVFDKKTAELAWIEFPSSSVAIFTETN
jgi:hypothetical protein